MQDAKELSKDVISDKMNEFFLIQCMMPNAVHIPARVMDHLKMNAQAHFESNYRSLANDSYLNELPPKIKTQLVRQLMLSDIIQFKFLFFESCIIADQIFLDQIVPHQIIQTLLSKIEYEMLSCAPDSQQKTVVQYSKEFSHFHMLKKGRIEVISKDSLQMYFLEPGSFFGEFNILFGVLSPVHYRLSYNPQDQSLYTHLFKVHRKELLEIICSHEETFLHFISIAL
jgi:hypothetical protein